MGEARARTALRRDAEHYRAEAEAARRRGDSDVARQWSLMAANVDSWLATDDESPPPPDDHPAFDFGGTT